VLLPLLVFPALPDQVVCKERGKRDEKDACLPNEKIDAGINLVNMKGDFLIYLSLHNKP